MSVGSRGGGQSSRGGGLSRASGIGGIFGRATAPVTRTAMNAFRGAANMLRPKAGGAGPKMKR